MAVLQCLQFDSRKRSVCIIIFSLHLIFLITENFESSQALNSLVQRVPANKKSPCIRNRSQFSCKTMDKTIGYCLKTIGWPKKVVSYLRVPAVEGFSIWMLPKDDMEGILKVLSLRWRDIAEFEYVSVEGVLGTVDQLLINACIMEEVKEHHRKLAVAYYDYKKAYDKVHHGWMLRVYSWMGIPVNVISLLRELVKSGRPDQRYTK